MSLPPLPLDFEGEAYVVAGMPSNFPVTSNVLLHVVMSQDSLATSTLQVCVDGGGHVLTWDGDELVPTDFEYNDIDTQWFEQPWISAFRSRYLGGEHGDLNVGS